MNDLVYKDEVIDAIEGTDWYHINRNGELVHGAGPGDRALYKAEDIYAAIEKVPTAAPKVIANITFTEEQVNSIAERIKEEFVTEFPERQKGTWEEQTEHWFRCSTCGWQYPSLKGRVDYKYCPMCGTVMKVR